MASATPPNASDFAHPSHLDASAHLGSNTHNLAAAATAAGYAADNHLAGLVEAATAAAGQDVSWSQNEDADAMLAGHGRALQNHLDGYGPGMQLGDGFGDPGNHDQAPFGVVDGGGRQTRGSNASLGLVGGTTRKRKRTNTNVDPAMTGGSQFADGGGDGNGDGNGLDIRELPPQQTVSEARAAGVHSAVALFRQPSATSKKYTRPPMSKLFSSLELSPENFLHLQAAAKAYMLDERHPERRDCVGQRGKGDTEMVKLRLWNCVRDFLDAEGYGNRFFGDEGQNEGMVARHMVWPRDEQQIISLVMPLLRRMVTNERQRQYAIETRKGGGAEEKNRRKPKESLSNITPEVPHPFHQLQPSGDMELGLADLLADGYPTDWETMAKSYETYNHDFRLDNLGSISGLSQPDWLGLVAAVDCHYQVVHNGVAAECDEPCESCNINHIVSSDSVSRASWRVGGQREEMGARNYFATGITRDVSRIIRDHLTHQDAHPLPKALSPSGRTQCLPPSSSTASSQLILSSQQSHPSSAVVVRISITQVGNNNKRILPRLDLTADKCPDLSTLLHHVRQHSIHHQQEHVEPTLPIRVWLEDGLATVQNDDDWIMALLAVNTVDWMDGELRVVLDGGGGSGS